MKYKQWFYIMLVVLGFGCRAIVDTPISFEGDQVMFGNGGGMTGAVTTHTLLETGQLFTNKSLSGDAWVEENRLSRKRTQSLLLKVRSLSLAKVDHNHPGNTYKFIRIFNQDKEHYISWGASEHPIAEDIKSYYFELVEAAKSSN